MGDLQCSPSELKFRFELRKNIAGGPRPPLGRSAVPACCTSLIPVVSAPQ